ncbi:MAG: DoxX family protein [Bacteroidetes bacterium]|nr:DoxX family protein [Bacteroidota bacterium]
MIKREKIFYWVATALLAAAMLNSGIIQLFRIKAALYDVTTMPHLGYPIYFLTILGVWKLLGVVAILVPRFPLIKEWAYAGFFFTLSGAAISHIAVGDKANEWGISLFLLTVTAVSWYFRPATRKFSISKLD